MQFPSTKKIFYNNDDLVGYGYIPNDTTKEETFFYPSDHLGSTSYITDDKANITQYDAYLPYGELLVDEHSSSEDLPYKFNGKQFDEETGLYYYGARYMDPIISLWYGVDNLTEKYVSVSSYTYCNGSPIANIDVMGMFPKGIIVKHVETVVLYQAVGSANTLMGIPHEVTYYTFTESVAHLLSLVANVPITYVKNARLEEFISHPKAIALQLAALPIMHESLCRHIILIIAKVGRIMTSGSANSRTRWDTLSRLRAIRV